MVWTSVFDVQVQRLQCSQGAALEAACCAWAPGGSHLVVAYSGGMGLLQLHEVRRVATLPRYFHVAKPSHRKQAVLLWHASL